MSKVFSFFLAIGYLSQVWAISMPTQPLKEYECAHCDSLSHTPLSTSWPIHDKLFKFNLTKQKSNKYHFEVTAAELQRGIPIYTLAPQAVLRIVPNNKKIVLPDSVLYLAKSPNIRLSFLEASTLSQNKSLDSSLSNLDKVIELKPEIGSGQFILSLTDFTILSTERFQIRIFDKASTSYLHVETNQPYYQYGDELITTVFLTKDKQRTLVNSIKASLLSPDGERLPITLEEIEPTLYRGKIKLNNEKNFPGQNWYVETDVNAKVGDQTINRHAHTAFSYAIPSAQVTQITRLPSSLRFVATINVATGSRYMLQAVLFKGDSRGRKNAIEIAQTAHWIAPGYSTLIISFKHKIDKKEHSPYYLGSIQLIDYGQLKPVYEHNSPIDISHLG
ncbi:DUF4785 domain-containing protein [Legionella gresilensis]|uniref:DUF4785 domain-containing protein n=1 Tax=Legionella gresilensis TaxID=91823 RepID=UPI0010417A24|nr:DUF4785 domain-containing protein [Legionella gresilensis]